MFRRLSLLLLLAIAPLNGMCYSTQGYSAYQLGCSGDYWPALIEGDGLFWNDWRHGGHATLFCPIFQPGNNVFFVQGSAGRFRDEWMASVGGGVRGCIGRCCGWGLNAFADYAYSDSTLSWWQGGGGAELFGGNWEMRVNGYIPQTLRFRTTVTDFSFTTVINGNQVDITETRLVRTDRPRAGFDCEAGYGFCIGGGAIWGHAGYFRFKGRQDLPILQGPRLRLTYRLNLGLPWGDGEAVIGGEWERTRVFGDQTSLSLRLSLPIGCYRCPKRCCMTTSCRQMGRSVRRLNGILLRTTAETVVTERTVGLWFFTENGAGVGSQVDPTNINNASTNSVAGDILFALNNDGVINAANAMGGFLTLKDRQQLYAFPLGTTMVTLDLGNGVTLPVTALPGNIGATLNQPNAVPVVRAANTNRVFGISLTGGTVGLEATTVSDLTVEQATFTNTGTVGLQMTDVGGTVLLDENTFSVTGGTGAFLTNDNVRVTLTATDNTFENSATGLQATADNATRLAFTATGNTFQNLTTSGIFVEKTGTGGEITGSIMTNTLTNITGTAPAIGLTTGVNAGGASLTYAVSMNTITGVANGSGIALVLGSAGFSPVVINALVSTNTLTTVGLPLNLDNLLAGANDVATVEFTGNTITAAGSQGVRVVQNGPPTTNVTITNNRDVGSMSPGAAFELRLSNGGTLCSTLTGNSTSRSTDQGIRLTNLGGTFETTNRDQLSARNNNMSVAPFVGTITNRTTPCPTPDTSTIGN